jgi:hypothetical protein
MGHSRRTCIFVYSKSAALRLKLYSPSLMHRAQYTRGSHHGNGQCASPLSFWSLVYLPSGHLLGQLLFEKTRKRCRKPRVGLRDALYCTTRRNVQSSMPLISEAAQLIPISPSLQCVPTKRRTCIGLHDRMEGHSHFDHKKTFR